MVCSLTQQQEQAVSHLDDWRVGALFMEPGTGKTRVALSLVNSTVCSDVFWVGPLRTLGDVQDEVGKWGGFAMASHYFGVESISSSDRIYMELYDAVGRSACPFIVVDESLKIKNATAKRTRRMLEVGKLADYKLVLNGTPLSRNLLDLWSQMEFLSPKILNMTLATFKNTFCKYTVITKRQGHHCYSREYVTGMENVDYLYSLIRHYVYECDLHLNITQNFAEVRYSLSEDERDEYQGIKDKYLSDEMLEWRNDNIFFAMTTELQCCYCCCQDKLRAVRDLFAGGVEPERTIIFCRFVRSRELCEREFPEAKVLSYQKEAFGLNLQEYCNTIYFDKVWDYALRTQSTRRTFRTGQEHDCKYWDLTGNVGLERLIDKNIEKKVSMSEYLKKVSLEDIRKEL